MRSPDNLISDVIRRATAWVRWRIFNPTRDWPSRAVSKLEFDLDECALNGVREGAPWTELEIFGPADSVDTLAAKGLGPDFSFFALGLMTKCYESTLVDFAIVTDGSDRPFWQGRGMAGTVTLTGGGIGSFEISKTTHERDLFSRLGPPLESGPVVGKMVHTFALPKTVLDTFHDPATGYVREVTLHRRG